MGKWDFLEPYDAQVHSALKEVESFAVLAQSQGAQAVLATLWSVADTSTATFMHEFYQQRKAGLSKGEALRQAQLALLRGTGVPGTVVDKAPQAPYAHPFYWALFVLIGNGR